MTHDVPNQLLKTIGVPLNKIVSTHYSAITKKLLCELNISRSELMRLKPDVSGMLRVIQTKNEIRGLILTIPSMDFTEFDCHSRYFAPWVGISEDPVTGSAHHCSRTFLGSKIKKNEHSS